MLRNKGHFRLIAFIILILGIIPMISFCGSQEEQFFGEVLSVEEICSRIRYIKKETKEKLNEHNYERKSKDSNNINLLKNTIKDRSISSWYYEIYENEKGTLITLTYSVEYSILWFEVEVNGIEGDYPIEDYKMAISFYQEFTYAKIAEERIYKLLENKRFKTGDYRIDSINYQDVFVFEVNEDNNVSTFLITGLVKSFKEEK